MSVPNPGSESHLLGRVAGPHADDRPETPQPPGGVRLRGRARRYGVVHPQGSAVRPWCRSRARRTVRELPFPRPAAGPGRTRLAGPLPRPPLHRRGRYGPGLRGRRHRPAPAGGLEGHPAGAGRLCPRPRNGSRSRRGPWRPSSTTTSSRSTRSARRAASHSWPWNTFRGCRWTAGWSGDTSRRSTWCCGSAARSPPA